MSKKNKERLKKSPAIFAPKCDFPRHPRNKINRREFLAAAAGAAAAAGLGLANPLRATVRETTAFDILIKNGLIHAGNGRAPVAGDLGIKDGKIAAIGNLGNNAGQVVDATALAVSPGFIDIHTHTDTNLFGTPAGDSHIHQGVTTDIGGNCGSSPFPYSDSEYAPKKDTLRHGHPYWQHIDGFYAALEKNKIGINYASLTGHGRLRSAVMGNTNTAKAAPAQIKQMQELLAKQMESGSAGMSCGLIYKPGIYATTDELVELCKIVAKYDGLFSIHMRSEQNTVVESLRESIDIARRSGARLQISHIKTAGSQNWHKAPLMLKLIDEAAASGIDIAFDRYPYLASSTGLSQLLPLSTKQGATAQIIARLKDPQKAGEIDRSTASRLKNLGGPRNITISSCRKKENWKYVGKNIEECSNLSGIDAPEFIRHILISENLSVNMISNTMSEDNLRLFYAHPLAMPGSDGSARSAKASPGSHPHPRNFGAFPRFLGTYSRELKIVGLPAAIYKMSALPASRLRLKDRGLLSPGYRADVVVFDPKTICELSTYTEPRQYNKGIEHVFVNGAWTIKHARHTGALAGSVIRHRG